METVGERVKGDSRPGAAELVARAAEIKTAIPAFNIPYLPMMEPVVRAVRDAEAFAFIDVARLEWVKFEARGPLEIKQEYDRCSDPKHTRLHLDHVPVIDEDDNRVDYLPVIEQALSLGYDSVMVDGSRLPLGENIAATRSVCKMAHAHGVPVEGELGAVLGHESGPMPPYEQLFADGTGFTDPAQAEEFVASTGVDWLSIAFGNIHGPISAAERKKEKISARLNIEHLTKIRDRVAVPIVLHGGSGIKNENIVQAIEHGVAKINIASDLRRPYEAEKDRDLSKARAEVYNATRRCLAQLGLEGTARKLTV